MFAPVLASLVKTRRKFLIQFSVEHVLFVLPYVQLFNETLPAEIYKAFISKA